MKNINKKDLIFNIYLITLIICFIVASLYYITTTGNISISLLYLIRVFFLIVPFFLTILILYSFRNETFEVGNIHVPLNFVALKKHLCYFFGILFFVSIIYLNLVYEKDISYIFLLVGLYLIIFFQILLTRTNPGLIISEIFLVFLNSIFSTTLRYPYYFGQTDIPVHVDWATIVYFTGRLIPSEYSNSIAYTFYPVLQIITSVGSNILNVTLLQSDLILTGIIFSLSIFFIYCVSKLIVEEKIALLTCLFYATTNISVASGIHAVPYCLAFVFFVLLLFLTFKINTPIKDKIIYIGLIIPIVIVLVFTHHATIFETLFILIIFYFLIRICDYLNNAKNRLSPFPIVILFGVFLIHWYYIARVQTITMERYAINFLTGSDITGISIMQNIKSSTEIGTIQETVNFIIRMLPFEILYVFVLLGIGIIIKQKFQKYLWIYIIFAFITLPLFIPVGSGVLNLLSQFALDRFVLLTSPFVMLILAFTFYYFLNYRFKILQKYIFIGLTLLFGVYSFTFLIQIPAYDYISPTSSMQYTPYFNEEDIVALNFFDKNTANDILIKSDYLPYRYYIKKNKYQTIQDIKFHYYRTEMIGSSGLNSNQEGYIFYREGEFKKANYLLLGIDEYDLHKSRPIPYREHSLIEQSFFSLNKITDTGNNKILVYRNPQSIQKV